MRVVNENEEEEEEDWSCLTRPPTFFPKEKRKKPVADVLAAVWWSRHTQREKSVVGYMCTQHRDTYILYSTIRPGGIGGNIVLCSCCKFSVREGKWDRTLNQLTDRV